MINDILDIAKIESGKFELHRVDFALDDLLETLEILRGRAEAKGVRLALHTAPEVPRELNGDADRLRQVLMNLIGNAIKFTAAGEVSVQVDLASSADPAKPLLRFRVSDTGPGIPADRLTQIFESFTQANSSTAHYFGGTGLGLTISRNLVQLMGGRLEATSEEGKGSVFTFAIPFAPAASMPHRIAVAPGLSSSPPVKHPANGRILLVDDSKDNQLLILAYLKHTAYKIETAKDGQEAIEKFTAGAFDLVLMDIQMPGVDGYTATRKIRQWEKQHGGGHVPILALTANAMAEESGRSREAGCDAHLTKPIPKAALLKAIDNYLKDSGTIPVAAPDGLEELVPGYLNNLRADLRALGTALEGGDYHAIEVLGHQMKGSGAGYGFAAVTEIGRNLEVAARTAAHVTVQAQIWALANYLGRVEIVDPSVKVPAAG